jgi:hypothetical protein
MPKKQIDNDGYVVPKSYGDYLIIDKPTTVDNFSFMVEYQFGYMYMRYLMWNFVGRQNDIQGDTIIKTEIGSAEYRLLMNCI